MNICGQKPRKRKTDLYGMTEWVILGSDRVQGDQVIMFSGETAAMRHPWLSSTSKPFSTYPWPVPNLKTQLGKLWGRWCLETIWDEGWRETKNQSSGPRENVDFGEPIGGHGSTERRVHCSIFSWIWQSTGNDQRERLLMLIRQMNKRHVHTLKSQSTLLFLSGRA